MKHLFYICALALCLAGCLAESAVDCGDGTVCPAGRVCLPAGGGCALPDQLTACAGIADGTSCTFAGGVGSCQGGVCLGNRCGNGKLDPGEVCDGTDGLDPTLGETCSPDCKTIYRCGNNVRDPGEECDDGNHNPADGCDECKTVKWMPTTLIGGKADATSLGLANPYGVAVDHDGNTYIADSDNNVIRRIDVSGFTTTIAGTGTPGWTGDGGVATSAELNGPRGVAVDGLGDVYVADTQNQVIRLIDPNGIITTVAGNGTLTFAGDVGPATSASLAQPSGVAVDGLGNLYIADATNNRVRRVDTRGVITTVAGDGNCCFSGDNIPATSADLRVANIALDGLGQIYIADGAYRVRKVDLAGVITTVAGDGTPCTVSPCGDGGAATSAQLSLPYGVMPDGLGNLYIAASANARIRRVDPAGNITTVAGTSIGFSGDGDLATNAQFSFPAGMSFDGAGNLYIADKGNGRIRRVDTRGYISTFAGAGGVGATGDGGSATSVVWYADALAADPAGNLYVSDPGAHCTIRRIDTRGVITTVAGTGSCGYGGDRGPATSALLRPAAVAVALGNIYVDDYGNNRIRRVDPAGVITTVAGTGIGGFSGDGGPATNAQISNATGVAADELGNLYIADYSNGRIRFVDTAGYISTIAGGGPSLAEGILATSALVDTVNVAVQGLFQVYISDFYHHRVRRVDTTGDILTVAGTGTPGFNGDDQAATDAQLYGPSAVAFDAHGGYFIADKGNHRVRRVDSAGAITTFAGKGTQGFSGDGAAAVDAQLDLPVSLGTDAVGNLYIMESIQTGRARIRRVDPAGVITTVAGTLDPEGLGPLAQAHLTDPRALVVSPSLSLVAGGTSGTVQAARSASAWLEVVAGRYPQDVATPNLARFRTRTFGAVGGIAYDPTAGLLYLTESSANQVHVVTMVDPNDRNTWTIAPLAGTGAPGYAGGATSTAQFRNPTGLYLDQGQQVLYVADTGNHVIRAIDLAGRTVSTIAGTPDTLGFFGDGGAATAALLYAPQALTRCPNGDLFLADTSNNRVRRIDASGTISTVLGDGTAASSGEGDKHASTFPVDGPLGVACDAFGNVFVTSRTAVRLLAASDGHVVDGTGAVKTIYGRAPRKDFPASVTTCLTGIASVDATTLQVVDSCTGLLVQLKLQ
jgi:cysteine-rich repeat protein